MLSVQPGGSRFIFESTIAGNDPLAQSGSYGNRQQIVNSCDSYSRHKLGVEPRALKLCESGYGDILMRICDTHLQVMRGADPGSDVAGKLPAHEKDFTQDSSPSSQAVRYCLVSKKRGKALLFILAWAQFLGIKNRRRGYKYENSNRPMKFSMP